MADDTPDTSEASPAETPAPRRKAARKTGDAAPKRAPAKRSPARPAKDKGVIAAATDAAKSVEGQVADAAKATRRAAGSAARKAEQTAVGAARKAGTAVGVVKPRSSKRKAATATKTTRKPATKSGAARGTDKVGGKWGVAAIAGGVIAAAGAAATLLTLRGSTPQGARPKGKPDAGAKQADGTDSSKSFQAGIADEGTIPNA